jgi:DUF4097 and DUF4098 domain-containing protein YvlB
MSRTPAFPARQGYQALLFCLLLVPLCAAKDWRYEESHTDSRDFVPGGYVHVRLSVGDLHIKRGDSARVRLEYTVKSRRESHLKEARVDFNVRGNDATIEWHAPTGSNTQIDVELEVPATTHLDVHQKVGDLTVDSIEGDKDLNLGVGDIRISTEHSGYRLVNASTGIGDVDSEGYGETHGWLGKTLKYHGEGKYELRAHVGVGDIKLEGR